MNTNKKGNGMYDTTIAAKVRRDTLITLDPSDVQKPYARKMEHLAKVWDGSRGEVGDNDEVESVVMAIPFPAVHGAGLHRPLQGAVREELEAQGRVQGAATQPPAKIAAFALKAI